MDAEHVDQVKDVAKINAANDSKLERKTRKIGKTNGTPCIYFEDTLCRVPFCDMEICSKCPKGCVYCAAESPNPLKKLLHKIMGIALILLAFLGEEGFLYEIVNRFTQSL